MTGGANDPEGSGAPSAAPAPPAAALAALGSDAWAWLLPHARRVLHELDPAEVTPTVRRLAAAPTSRLAGGRVRRELEALLASGGAPWRALVSRLRDVDAVPASIAALLAGRPAPDAPRHTGVVPGRPVAAERPRHDPADRLRERLRSAREERDELRRQLDGALARAVRSEAASASLAEELAAARATIAGLEVAVAAAADDRARAVDRERRRRDGEVAALEAQLVELRRAEDERRRERRRREEQARQDAAAARRAVDERRAGRERAPRLVPGRPSLLPDGVRSGTTEEADLLLHAGRLVYVDGYNVTRQHQPDLGLEEQRAWLVRLLAALAARRRVRPTVVFDGQRAGGSRPVAGSREVVVRFTPAGVTADDELVLAADATDEPVTVVTDDRELRDRLRAVAADVIGTGAFLGVAR